MGVSRWKRAIRQERSNDRVDRGHPHFTDDEINHVLQKFWDISLDAFKTKRLLAVGGGRGLIHGINNAAKSISIDPIYGEYGIHIQKTPTAVIKAAGEYLPFEPNSFEVAFSHHVLEHTHLPQKILSEVYNVLEPGGEYYLQVLDTPLPQLVREWIAQQDIFGIETAHPYMFTRSEIEQMLSNVGFEYEVNYYKRVPINQFQQGVSVNSIAEYIYKQFKRQRNFAVKATVPK